MAAVSLPLRHGIDHWIPKLKEALVGVAKRPSTPPMKRF